MELKNVTLDIFFRLPPRRRLIILVAIYFVITAAYWQVFFNPKWIEAKDLHLRIAELGKEIHNENITASQLPKIRQEKKEFEERLKNAVAQMPNEKEIAGLLHSLSSLGKESGLEILLFKPGAENIKGFYAEVPVDMKVQGGYENLLSFFKKVSSLQRIVNISRLNIGEPKEGGDSPMLASSFTAITFRFLKEDEIKKEKDKEKEKGEGK